VVHGADESKVVCNGAHMPLLPNVEGALSGIQTYLEIQAPQLLR
jgi:hypothetical protein